MLRDNLKNAINKSGLTVREVALEAGVKKRTIDEWLSQRENMPRAKDLYAVCRVIKTTVEEVLDGEFGRRYIRNRVADEDLRFVPPTRIADIVNQLMELEDKSLEIIRGTIGGILAGEKAGRQTEDRTGTSAV